MTLYVKHLGAGPTLVLLHGWGHHCGVWRPLVNRLAVHFRVTLVDLPGHGRSEVLPQGARLEEVAKAVVAAVPSPAVWLGWSLGGLVALQVAIQHPVQVNKLVLVASTPRFVTAPDWPTAVSPEVLTGFEKSLQDDSRNTLKRFAWLQSRGSGRSKEVFQELFSSRSLSLSPGNKGRLEAGLTLLRESDLRADLGAVRCPALVIMGERDSLVPMEVGKWMRSRLAQGQLCPIPRAGHAPFLSHPELFAAALENFLAIGISS